MKNLEKTMPRYKITIEYDGTGLAGWQAQPDNYSVQEALGNALEKFCQQRPDIQCAGRTDAGVHALAMAAHFDLEKEADVFRIKEGMNFYLRDDERLAVPMQIAVLSAEKVDAEFNARFSAKRRFYRYRIINRRGHLALEQNRAWCVHDELDVEKMQEAAKLLIGKHDFTSFRSTDCQSKNPVKTLDELKVEKFENWSGPEIIITTNAQSYLHHMVRNIVGSLKLVGTSRWEIADMQKALDAKDRTAAGPTAPAQGLYFVKVEY